MTDVPFVLIWCVNIKKVFNVNILKICPKNISLLTPKLVFLQKFLKKVYQTQFMDHYFKMFVLFS